MNYMISVIQFQISANFD